MIRTPFVEQPDGSLTCTITIPASELARILAEGLSVSAVASAPAVEKPPAQEMAIKGFEAFVPMRSDPPDNEMQERLRKLVSSSTFQRYVETIVPMLEDGDAVVHAADFVNARIEQLDELLRGYVSWHQMRWPNEPALPWS